MDKHIRKRLHPFWIIFQLGLTVKEIIIPAVIFFIFNIGSDALWVKIGSIAILLFLLYRVISIFFQWKNYTYLLTNNNLEIVEGRFITKKRYISLNRIQGYQQHTTFFHRLLGFTSISIQTGATTENAVIKLEMISNKEAENMKKIFNQYVQSTNATSEPSSNKEKIIKKHYKISFSEIFLISLTSLYFLAIFPIILSLYAKLTDLFTLNDIMLNVYEWLRESIAMIMIVSLVILFLAVGFGIFITYLRFGNYTVSSDQDQIYIAKGILNTSYYTIPRNKINGLIIKKTFPRRLLKIVRVELISLGDVFDENDLETDILFPFIRESRLKSLLPEIVPEFHIQEDLHPLPKQALFVNLIQPSYTLVIVTFFVFFFWPEYWFIPLAFFLWLVFYRVLKTKQTKYIQSDQWIQFQTGVLSSEIFITKREKIDELEIAQSWLEQKLGLATISISSRAKPVHSSAVEHLPVEKAYEYFNWYQEEMVKDHVQYRS